MRLSPSTTSRPRHCAFSTRASTPMGSRYGRPTAGASRFSASRRGRRACPSRRSGAGNRGPFASRTWRRAWGEASGSPTRAQGACSGKWSPPISSSGARATGSCSPGRKTAGTHLYTVPVAGGRATLLTPGGFEVEHVTLSPDRATVVFSSNQDDIERRHIWKVAVSGGPPTAVTRGTGLEWTPVVTGDGRGVAFIQAGTRTPPHPVLQVGSASPRDLAPGAIPAEFPEGALVDPQPVLFPAADGMTIHAQLFLPRGVKGGE